MRIISRRLASALAISALALAAAATAAPAAPTNAPNATTVTLDCGEAGTFDVVVNGNGEWAPGHLATGGVLIPVAFGEQTIVVRDGEGNVVDEQTLEAMTKGRAKARHRDRLTCSFTATFTEDELTITVTGTVTGFASGRPSTA